MSGVSSEGVAPILGLSGSVAMPALLSWAVGGGRWTDLSLLAGLLHHAHIHSNGRNTCLGR
jgi:hypothetical protein